MWKLVTNELTCSKCLLAHETELYSCFPLLRSLAARFVLHRINQSERAMDLGTVVLSGSEEEEISILEKKSIEDSR